VSFPTVVARNGGNSGGNTTTHTIKLPDGSNVIGRLVVWWCALDGGSGTTIDTAPTPGTWFQRLAVSNSTIVKLVVYRRVIDGTEGFTGTNDTISFTTNNSEGSSHQSSLIIGHSVSTNEIEHFSGGVTGSSTNPDPPSVTPAGGSKDYLFIAIAGNDGNVAITAGPGSYTDFRNDRWANANGTGVAAAERQLTTGSAENPGVFTMATEQWCTDTLIIYPGTEGLNQTLEATPAVIRYVGADPTLSASITQAATPAIVRWVAIAPSLSAGGGGQTLTATPAIIRYVGIPPSLTPGASTLSATPGIIRYVAIGPSRTTTVTRSASPGIVRYLAVAPATTPGASTRSAIPAIVRYLGITPSLSPGASTRSPTAAVVRWVAIAPSISAGGGNQIVSATPGVIRWVAVTPSRTAGAATVSAVPAIVRWIGINPTRISGAVTRAATPGVVHWVAVAPSRTAAIAVSASTAVIRWRAVAPTAIPGAIVRAAVPAIVRWVAIAPTITGGIQVAIIHGRHATLTTPGMAAAGLHGPGERVGQLTAPAAALATLLTTG